LADQGEQQNGDAGFGLPSSADRLRAAAEQESSTGSAGVTLQFHPDGAKLVPAFADLGGREKVV